MTTRTDALRRTWSFVFGILACSCSSSTTAPDGGDAAGSGDSDAAAQVVTHNVLPSDTSAKIVPTIGDHFVAIGPAAVRRGRLLLFYPGTNARPDQYASFLTRAAALGYHAIGLAYHNEYRVNFDICVNNPPPDCYEKVRLEILLGVESGYNPPDVDADNAAFNRIIQLLKYLDPLYPSEGWGAYLDAGGAPKWDLITFGGHSQGGGHAAMTAKLETVDRAILFNATEPQAWTTTAFATLPERFFGFAHTGEPIYQGIWNSWKNLGIPGAMAPTSVDGATAPFGGSHSLSTSFANCPGEPGNALEHNCTSVDGWFPFAADGTTPLFQPVWDYLMLGPVQ